MKIDIVPVVGSPMLVTEKTVYGDGEQFGVGGAELYLLTICKAWHDAGHDVTLYNNPREFRASCFKQKMLAEFNPQEDRDILIYFRGGVAIPNVKARKKIWLSCDQYSVGDYRALAGQVDQVVVISPFHKKFFEDTYGIKDSTIIEIPVRGWEYREEPVQKNLKQVLFCSVPDRGIAELESVWRLVNKAVPDAQLHITSDYRLWDAKMSPNHVMPHRLRFSDYDNVHYHALVNRKELVRLQLESAIQLYPSTYQELFCISTAECEYAGCYPITSNYGALETTNMGTKFAYPITGKEIKEFADETISLLQNPWLLKGKQTIIREKAQERFSMERAISEWENAFSS